MTKDEALQLALEALEFIGDAAGNKAITAIREALAEQPAQHQEPVAVVSGYYGGQCVIIPTNPAMLFNSGTALYASSQPAQQQEPVAWVDRKFGDSCVGWYQSMLPPDGTKLYTSPQSWVGLTIEDKQDILLATNIAKENNKNWSWDRILIDVTAAKLKEKNT